MKGGKREGAGRPPSTDPANKLVTVKLTQSQYKKWVEIGASRWLKRMLESAPQIPMYTVSSEGDRESKK